MDTVIKKFRLAIKKNIAVQKQIADNYYKICADINKYVDSLSNTDIEQHLKELAPESRCTNTFGPHDDYYVVYRNSFSSAILGTGDDAASAKKDALKKCIRENLHE